VADKNTAKSDEVSTEVDASGRLVDRRPLNDLKPTTRFAPSELPANPIARAAFPKGLIDENNYTESPGSDSPLERRLASAEKALKAEEEKIEALLGFAKDDENGAKAGTKAVAAEASAKGVDPAPADSVEAPANPADAPVA
jgi:hypothetical protein